MLQTKKGKVKIDFRNRIIRGECKAKDFKNQMIEIKDLFNISGV